MKKKLLFSSLLVTSLLIGSALTSCGDDNGVKSIGILKFVDDTPLNLAQDGFIEGLKEKGFVDKETININLQNPNADSSKNTSMASNLVLSNDLVFGIATPSAVALKASVDKNGLETPVLFTAVTDPVGAKLVNSMKNHEDNVCGMSDMTDVNLILNALKEFETIDTIGILYNISESNSQFQVEQMKNSIKEKWSSLNVVDKGVSDDNMIKNAISSMPDSVDAIYIPTDNHIADAIKQVREVAKTRKFITICADASLTTDGAMIGIGVDYATLGKEVGYMAASILSGEKTAKDIDCKFQEEPITYINLDIAKEAGITIPDSLINSADKVIGA